VDSNIATLEECEDNACTGCPWCDAHGITSVPARIVDGEGSGDAHPIIGKDEE